MTKKTKKRKSLTPLKAPNIIAEQPSSNCYQGDCLNDLLQKLGRSIEEAKQLKGQLPDKIWNKQQFAIGVNDVTRVLERMPRDEACVGPAKEAVSSIARRVPLVPLQVRGSIINKAIHEILYGSSPVMDDTLEMDQRRSILSSL